MEEYMGAIVEPKVKWIQFGITVRALDPNMQRRMIDDFNGEIFCYENGVSGPAQKAGWIEGFIIKGNFFRVGMNAIQNDEESRDELGEEVLDICDELVELEGGDEPFVAEVIDLCESDVENPDILVFSDIYLKPDFRHKGLGRRIIRVVIDHLGKSTCAVAICPSPTQAGLSDGYHAAMENIRGDQGLLNTLNSRGVHIDLDLQEFEALNVEEAQNKLLVHFSNMGFRLLPWSDNLMVISPFEIECE